MTRVTLLMCSNVSFYTGDISKIEDVQNALRKVSSLQVVRGSYR